MAEQTDKSKVRVFVTGTTIETRELIQSIKDANSSRAMVFNIIQTMLKDPTVNSILTGIKEDFTQAFEDGRIIKSVSNDPTVQNAWDAALVNFGAEKQIGNQMMIMLSFGELYGQMFTLDGLRKKLQFADGKEKRETQFEKSTGSKEEEKPAQKDNDVLIQKLYTIDNPLEFYDVQYLGETVFFYRKKVDTASDSFGTVYKQSDLFKYSDDILVHVMLYPSVIKEKMDTGAVDGDGEAVELTIERGVGLLEKAYPAYVNLMLAKAAMLIARDARSVVVTLLKMNREGMTDEEAEATTDAIMEKVTVRRSLDKTQGAGEYTNSVSAPAVVMVTKDGETGDVTAEQIGGDYDAGSLSDIENLEDDFYGAFRTVKQKFGKTGDAAGFSGGESLQLLMDSYAQMGGYIQQTLCDFWEIVINRYFESKGLTKFVGSASLRMKKMPTSSETDKENLRDTSVRLAQQVTSDVMDMTSESLRIYRTMLNRTDLNNDLIELLDELIEKREAEEKQAQREASKKKGGQEDRPGGGYGDREYTDVGGEEEDEGMLPPMSGILDDLAEGEEPTGEPEAEPEGEADMELPDMLKVVRLYDNARAAMKGRTRKRV